MVSFLVSWVVAFSGFRVVVFLRIVNFRGFWFVGFGRFGRFGFVGLGRFRFVGFGRFGFVAFGGLRVVGFGRLRVVAFRRFRVVVFLRIVNFRGFWFVGFVGFGRFGFVGLGRFRFVGFGRFGFVAFGGLRVVGFGRLRVVAFRRFRVTNIGWNFKISRLLYPTVIIVVDVTRISTVFDLAVLVMARSVVGWLGVDASSGFGILEVFRFDVEDIDVGVGSFVDLDECAAGDHGEESGEDDYSHGGGFINRYH